MIRLKIKRSSSYFQGVLALSFSLLMAGTWGCTLLADFPSPGENAQCGDGVCSDTEHVSTCPSD